MDGFLRDSAERSEGADHLLSNREGRRRLGGGGSRVDKLDDEIRRRRRPIASVIWRETGARVLSVIERRRAEVTTIG